MPTPSGIAFEPKVTLFEMASSFLTFVEYPHRPRPTPERAGPDRLEIEMHRTIPSYSWRLQQ